MSKDSQIAVVYVVTCYQNIVGIYAEMQDAVQMVKEYISKNRPADLLTKTIVYPLKSA